jgi:hypothetical protein
MVVQVRELVGLVAKLRLQPRYRLLPVGALALSRIAAHIYQSTLNTAGNARLATAVRRAAARWADAWRRPRNLAVAAGLLLAPPGARGGATLMPARPMALDAHPARDAAMQGSGIGRRRAPARTGPACEGPIATREGAGGSAVRVARGQPAQALTQGRHSPAYLQRLAGCAQLADDPLGLLAVRRQVRHAALERLPHPARGKARNPTQPPPPCARESPQSHLASPPLDAECSARDGFVTPEPRLPQ